MRLYYIGTGAADWTEAAGEKDGVRRRFTATLLDTAVLIDLAPTTPLSLFDAGGKCAGVTDVLYTHSHDDHFDASTLLALAETGHDLHIHATSQLLALVPAHPHLHLHPLSVGEECLVAGYRVLPLRANHLVRQNPEEQPLHYIISDGKKRIFWGADGAWLYSDTWRAMIGNKPYDRMILDGTLGEGVGDTRIFEHNNLRMVMEMKATFEESELYTPAGQLWLTHLSRDAHVSPRQLADEMKKKNIHVAFDDMEDVF